MKFIFSAFILAFSVSPAFATTNKVEACGLMTEKRLEMNAISLKLANYKSAHNPQIDLKQEMQAMVQAIVAYDEAEKICK
jgi:flagellar basal body rod protein FlgC